jgi:SAM-dependent methyltransferase
VTEEETLKVYSQKAADYESMTQGAVARDPLLASFIADLPAASHVLDLGCGPGLFAAAIARAGHNVTATDAVAQMVARAARHPGVTAILARFDDISGTDVYDGIWANFSLLHATRSDMPRHLAALSRCIKPGGLFHIALKAGTGCHRDALGRSYTYYTPEELGRLVAQAGFSVTFQTLGRDKGLDGTYADWIALRAYG